MAFTIIIKSVDDIKRFRQKITGLKIQLFEFQAYTVRRLADIIITDTIHKNMKDAGFSEKIINGTFLDNIENIKNNKVRLFFRSEYFSSTGFDVALAREEGTEKHKIVAGKGKVLPIPTSEGIIFRKSAYPDGILALFIVSKTVKNMAANLQDEYNRQQNIWYGKNIEGVANFAS
jgi:hypothetical protein